MRVAVLMGGRSREREISLRTGRAVMEALSQRGYEAVSIDPGPGAAQEIASAGPDVCFIALHGRFGEDGTIQGLLEVMGIPYTGSGVLASAAAMDKVYTKKLLSASGLPTPVHNVIARGEEKDVMEGLTFPVVVKPSLEGSSLGLSIVDRPDELPAALATAFSYGCDVLVEEFVEGKEITVGVIGNSPQALPLIEIVPSHRYYDYETKYTKGKTEYIIPARLEAETAKQAREMGVAAHKALGCRGISRVDLIVGPRGIQILEVNTIPGMTETSLIPKAALAAGITFPQLVEQLLMWALEGR